MNRLQIALFIYGGIAVAEWFALRDQVRLVALAFIFLLALRTWLHSRRQAREAAVEPEADRKV